MEYYKKTNTPNLIFKLQVLPQKMPNKFLIIQTNSMEELHSQE